MDLMDEAMTYSIDFRKKVLAIKKKENLSFKAAGDRFDVAASAIFRWEQKLEPSRTRYKPAFKIDMDALAKDVEARPDDFIYERANRLGVSNSGILHALKRLNITYKKNGWSPESGSRKKKNLSGKDSCVRKE
jgi:transposase